MHVLVLGGGVAALEAALALRWLAGERIELELMAPDDSFVARPLSVLGPFEDGEPPRYALADLLGSLHTAHRRDRAVAVDADARVVRTESGERVPYDVLLVALGARPLPALAGALTFRGAPDVPQFRDMLAAADRGNVGDIAFAAPAGQVWTLPLYELALLTAARLRDAGTRITVVSAEQSPLALFGRAASEAVADVLAERGVQLVLGCHPSAVEAGALVTVPGSRRVPADRVVAMPRLEGARLPGIPHDSQGFIPTDLHGRVLGAEHVYAAGDGTAFPVKQGGIAAQQADAAAEAIAESVGAQLSPAPFQPTLRGQLLTGADPEFLENDLRGGAGETASRAATWPLWWPPGKIAGRYLAPFLASHGAAGAGSPPPAARTIDVEVALDPLLAGGAPEQATSPAPPV